MSNLPLHKRDDSIRCHLRVRSSAAWMHNLIFNDFLFLTVTVLTSALRLHVNTFPLFFPPLPPTEPPSIPRRRRHNNTITDSRSVNYARRTQQLSVYAAVWWLWFVAGVASQSKQKGDESHRRRRHPLHRKCSCSGGWKWREVSVEGSDGCTAALQIRPEQSVLQDPSWCTATLTQPRSAHVKIRVFLWRHRGSISHRSDWGKLEATSPPGRSWGFSRNLIDQLAPPTSTNTGIWMNKCSLINYSQEESPKGFVVSWKIINVLFSIV